MKYESICYMDTDVYIQGSFDAIWTECRQNIMLYDINHEQHHAGLTEGNAAVHATAALLPLFFQRERNMELVKIFNSVFGRNRRTCLSCKL